MRTTAAAVAFALFGAGCASGGGSFWNNLTADTGASSSQASGYGASGEVVLVPDPAGSASEGTGSVSSGPLGNDVNFGSGIGID
jgi:hypothetical protein